MLKGISRGGLVKPQSTSRKMARGGYGTPRGRSLVGSFSPQGKISYGDVQGGCPAGCTEDLEDNACRDCPDGSTCCLPCTDESESCCYGHPECPSA